MRKYVLSLAIVMAGSLPSLAIAANADQTKADTAGVVQLSDEEMDNVSAAGLGQANAPGQLLKQQRLLRLQSVCEHGNSCNAPGRTRGASSFAPRNIR